MSGNSHIHDCILECIGDRAGRRVHGVVCGDDGNVDASTVDESTLRKGFEDLGLTLKQLNKLPHMNFCKLKIDNRGVQADISRMFAKMRCKHGEGAEAVCAASVAYIMEHANQWAEFKNLDLNRYVEGVWTPVL